LIDFIKKEQKAGKLKTIDPRLMQFLRTTAAATAVAGGDRPKKKSGLTPLSQ
jgi:hypothetical protein